VASGKGGRGSGFASPYPLALNKNKKAVAYRMTGDGSVVSDAGGSELLVAAVGKLRLFELEKFLQR